jgi:hypothetical protein
MNRIYSIYNPEILCLWAGILVVLCFPALSENMDGVQEATDLMATLEEMNVKQWL